MSAKTRSRNLYTTPFSRAYWIEAASELKNVKILVIAALMIALRVGMKWAYIPIAPNLNINIGGPLVNALGAMIFGPVVAGLAACVSDTLGCMLFPQGPYFFPCMFVEVAGSVIFGMFFYRTKITASRVILARFSMDLLVNIGLNSAVMCWYYQALLGKSYVAMILPVMIPLTYRAGLTFDNFQDKNSLKFSGKQFATLAVLFAVGVSCVFGYLFYHYDHTSLSGKYSPDQRYSINCQMTDVLKDQTDDLDEETLVTTVESAYRKFGKGYTTYTFAVYVVDEDALEGYEKDLKGIQYLSKSKARKVAEDGVMERVATATARLDNKTDEVLEFQIVDVSK